MTYILFSAFLLLISLYIVYKVCRLFFKTPWFLAWLKGTCGFGLIFLVLILAVIAIDIASYNELVAEKDIATIRFEKNKEQHYTATLITNSGDMDRYELYGDQWQLDSRILKWSSQAARLGIKTGYRLERLAGRYISLNDERDKPRRLYALNESPWSVDIWMWLNNIDDKIGMVDARYGNSVFLPMSDGAFFQIALSNTGLVARPLNRSAKDAVKQWQ